MGWFQFPGVILCPKYRKIFEPFKLTLVVLQYARTAAQVQQARCDAGEHLARGRPDRAGRDQPDGSPRGPWPARDVAKGSRPPHHGYGILG